MQTRYIILRRNNCANIQTISKFFSGVRKSCFFRIVYYERVFILNKSNNFDNIIFEKAMADNDGIKIYTVNELWQKLDYELSKPEDEIDFGLVDELTLSIMEATGQEAVSFDVDKHLKELEHRIHSSKKPIRLPKWVAVLTAACFIIFCGNIYSVLAWDTNIFSFIVELTRDGAVIDFSSRNDEINIPVSEDDPYGILAVCRENGINIETPHYLPDGFELTTLQTEPDERYVCMTYKRSKRDKAFISMTFQPYIDHIFIPSDENNFSEIQINGHSAIMSREDNQMIVVLSSHDSTLTLMTQDVDYDECDKILKEMR